MPFIPRLNGAPIGRWLSSTRVHSRWEQAIYYAIRGWCDASMWKQIDGSLIDTPQIPIDGYMTLREVRRP